MTLSHLDYPLKVSPLNSLQLLLTCRRRVMYRSIDNLSVTYGMEKMITTPPSNHCWQQTLWKSGASYSPSPSMRNVDH